MLHVDPLGGQSAPVKPVAAATTEPEYTNHQEDYTYNAQGYQEDYYQYDQQQNYDTGIQLANTDSDQKAIDDIDSFLDNDQFWF